MYEHYRQPLLPQREFVIRVLRCVLISLVLLVATIGIGAAVYRYIENLAWIDAILNAVMIMTGIGIVSGLNTSVAKAFTSFYALFSTIIYFAVIAILFSPLLHRFSHRFHLEIEKSE
jgi:predicted membrane-bound spermidine synthase